MSLRENEKTENRILNNFQNKLNKALSEAGIDLDEDKLCKLNKYYEMLTEKNKVMNLTAITEEDDFISKHFVDSLSIITQTNAGKKISECEMLRVIDVGTGAGFPGMVLKIAYPQLNMILFDSLKKRLLFLDEVIAALKLTDICTIHGRAEDLGHDPLYRETQDMVLARAVANLNTLAEYCLPLTKVGGCFIAYKSTEMEQECKAAERAINLLGGKTEEKKIFQLPGTEFTRSFAVIKKIKKTDKQYPRKAGTPSREPLS